MAQFRIGQFSCAVIDAGRIGPTAATDMCVNAAPDEAIDYLGAVEVMTGLNCLVVRGDDNVILIDSGVGVFKPGGVERMLAGLLAEGVLPDDVSTVLTSHAHPDHIGGHVIDGAPAFPRARYLFSKTEWDYFAGGTGVEAFDRAAQSVLPVLEDAGVVPGLGTIVAAGDTCTWVPSEID